MANTTKTITNTKTVTTDTVNTDIKSENEVLKEKLAEMEDKMKTLIQQMSVLSQFTPAPVKTVASIDKDIEVANLCVGPLLLSTNGRADGRRYDFDTQFQIRYIPESDLKEIVRSMPNTATSGRFFINDEDFVRSVGLSSSYKNMLDRVKLSNLFNLNADDFIKTYRGASKVQKSIIEQMVTNKCMENENIDANILRAISKETGKDYMNIEPLPEEYSALKEG